MITILVVVLVYFITKWTFFQCLAVFFQKYPQKCEKRSTMKKNSVEKMFEMCENKKKCCFIHKYVNKLIKI